MKGPGLEILSRLSKQSGISLEGMTAYYNSVHQFVSGDPVGAVRVLGALDLRRRAYLVNSAIIRQLRSTSESDPHRKHVYFEVLAILAAREQLVKGLKDVVEVYFGLQRIGAHLPLILLNRGALGSSDRITRFGHLCSFGSFLQAAPKTPAEIHHHLRHEPSLANSDHSMLGRLLNESIRTELDDMSFAHWCLRSALASMELAKVQKTLQSFDERNRAAIVGIALAEEIGHGAELLNLALQSPSSLC